MRETDNLMGKTQYQKCVELLKEFQKPEITFDELIFLIRTKIGNSKYSVIKPCFELMIDAKLIEEIENGKFRILQG